MTCTHHWLIPSGTGDEALSTCKKCGAEKTFYNTIDLDNWRGVKVAGTALNNVKMNAEHQRVIELHEQGLTPQEIAKKSDYALTTVYYILRTHGIKTNRRSKYDERDADMLRRRDAGERVADIAKDYGITADTAYKVIRAARKQSK